ncbi:hypothetical protein [Deinococcus malanensis]|uniref:hypothetical protein n=1 Tax=Deinococcus malanensis TaxID=1706855 RepID=UPI001669A737|nr:hypothetical protein [Deinococcus malanensis]
MPRADPAVPIHGQDRRAARPGLIEGNAVPVNEWMGRLKNDGWLTWVVVTEIPSLDPTTGVVGAQGLAYENYGALDIVTPLMGHLMFGLLTGVLFAAFQS